MFEEDTGTWTVRTGDGTTLTARYVVTALGLLSKTNLPDIKARGWTVADGRKHVWARLPA